MIIDFPNVAAHLLVLSCLSVPHSFTYGLCKDKDWGDADLFLHPRHVEQHRVVFVC